MHKRVSHHLLTVAFAAILTTFALLAVIAWVSASKSARASQSVEHSYQVIGMMRQITAKLSEAEWAQRGYLMTGANGELTLRDDALKALHEDVDTTVQLTADNAAQQVRLRQLNALLADRERLYHGNEATRLHGGLAALSGLIGSAAPLRDRTGALVAQMIDEEQRLLRLREQKEASRVLATQWSCTALVGLLLAVVLALFWRIRREIGLRDEREAAVRASEALLKQILDVLPVGVSVADASGKLTLSNPAAHQLAGYAVALPETGHARAQPSEALAPGEWALARTVQKRETFLNEDIEVQSMDRHRKSILLSGVPLRDERNAITGGVAVTQDVSALKETEQQLRAAARFDDSRNEALALFNASFDRQKIADGLLALLADKHPFPVSALYRHDEWLGKFVCEASWGLPSGVSREFAFGEGVLGQVALRGHTVVLDVADKMPNLLIQTGVFECRPSQVLLVPVVYQERRLAVLALAADRLLDEQEIAFVEGLCVQFGIALHNLALYADTRLLADQLRMRSEEIAQKNSQLEAGSRMKSEFLASMSHELRTPLNAIIGFSEVLKDGLAGELTPEQSDYIGDIFSSGQHLLSLINDVLDLSKVEAGKMEFEPEPVDVRALLQNSLAIVKEPAFARHIRLTLDVNLDEQTMLQADERKLKQIVYNLLSNAVKFSADDGEVTVSARRVTRADIDGRASAHAGRTIALPAGEHSAFLEIRVTDKGIGIPSDALGRLFEPFTQVDAGLARRFEGTGLGLALVHRLAELHGGTVRVESAEHHGSSFFVWIPWRPADDSVFSALAAAPALQPLPAAAEARWVLVIEDDEAAARLIRRQLESEGLNVLRVDSAEAALDAASEHPFALITLDIMLPGMDGWQFLNRIKDVPALARVPVVIISIVADGNRGISLGAAAILQKPFSRDQLHRALANLGFDTSDERPLLTLVADDDPKAVEIIAASLPEPGFRVLRAYGGREAIDVARQHTPDLIVLDLMMPEVNGFDVVEALKNDPRTAQIPVLVVTAKHIEAEDRARLSGHVINIVGKSEFNHGRFVNEVRRALITRKDEISNAAHPRD